MPEPFTTTAVLAKAATPAVEAALKEATPSLLRGLGRLTKTAKDRIVVGLRLGLNEYLSRSYESSRYFKSILNTSVPLSVADDYVHINLKFDGRVMHDSVFINSVNEYRHSIVIGLAGGGKSMLMRFMTLTKFEKPDGRIPLFIELRHLNSFTNKNLMAFIRATSVNAEDALSEDQFKLALKAGVFLLILDGFDEVNYEFRGIVQDQILNLSRDYPNCTIVISSRPDDRFGGWRSFSVFKVEELSKDQCLLLVDKLPYESGVKKRFKREVSSKLYDSHKSFLSSPLLTTIMLLTFEAFAEIPNRMHAFYGQAFDTLFQKHDAQKEQFQRKTHTGLKLDDFRSCFAAFCAMSYLDENFSFDDVDLRKTAEAAVKYLISSATGFSVRPNGDQLIEDLKSSVCMLQADGLRQSFVHRSFQEYFAAVFAVGLHRSKVRSILDKYAFRYGDSTISMALDMARETVEQEWVLPTIDYILSDLSERNGESVGRRMSRFSSMMYIYREEDHVMVSVNMRDNELVSKFASITLAYRDKFVDSKMWGHIFILPANALDYVAVDKYSRQKNYKKFLRVNGDRRLLEQFEVDEASSWWLRELNIHAYADVVVSKLQEIKKDILSREKRRRAILDDFM